MVVTNITAASDMQPTNKILLWVIIFTLIIAGICISGAEEIWYADNMPPCTLIPNNISATYGLSTIENTLNNRRTDIIIEPDSCMQATLPNGVTATAIFGTATSGDNVGVFGPTILGANNPIMVHVSDKQKTSIRADMGETLRHNAIIDSNTIAWDSFRKGTVGDTEHQNIEHMILRSSSSFDVYDNGNDLIWNSGHHVSMYTNPVSLNLQITPHHANGYTVAVYLNRPNAFFTNEMLHFRVFKQ